MPLKENMMNHIGCMYSGALFTLADMANQAIIQKSFDLTKRKVEVIGYKTKFVA